MANLSVRELELRGVSHAYIITDGNGTTVLQHFDSMIVTIDHSDWNNKRIIVGKDYNYSRSTGMARNRFMGMFFGDDMNTLKGFEYYMNLGAIGNHTIVKNF